MRKMTRFALTALATVAFASTALTACGEAPVLDAGGEDNPFLDDGVTPGKADTHYLNPDGVEIEVDIEADIEAPEWRMKLGPATLAQYAMTYLRNKGTIYLESLAEDASSPKRVEWLVTHEDGTYEWVSQEDAADLDLGETRRFRIRGVNAVLLHQHTHMAEEGRGVTVPVPVAPYRIMEEAGDRCADYNSHITLSESVYWYLWNPGRAGCDVRTQEMRITVSKVLPVQDSYPEYDRLIEDGKITTVVLFGQILDDLNEWDPGFRNMNRMARNLEYAGYDEVEAPLGRRFQKLVAGVTLEVDMYSPNEFSSLSDHKNYKNFERAIQEHEIVAYDGHSMLGSSDFWARPEYPQNYQIFLYGGCLGYEYYVRPIVEGKGGWENVDIVSSVIEVTADANYYTGPVLAKLEVALENGFNVSWKDLLGAIRNKVGDSTFGASGVRENCFSPEGDRCAE
jgi:hypothetical protein